jgi:hypothetical protein
VQTQESRKSLSTPISPLEMTMHRFLHGLKYIKGIVRHHRYDNMNELPHLVREAESQLADEVQIKAHAIGVGRYTPRAPPSTVPTPSSRPTNFPTSSSYLVMYASSRTLLGSR